MFLMFMGLMIGLFICIFSWQVGLSIFGLCIIIALFPVEGFESPKCVEYTSLIRLKLANTTEKKYFVVVKGNKFFYAYDNRRLYELEGQAYEETYIKGKGKIKIYESGDCEEPCLKKFEIKPCTDGGFAWAPFSKKTEYVFYVPEGTVKNMY